MATIKYTFPTPLLSASWLLLLVVFPWTVPNVNAKPADLLDSIGLEQDQIDELVGRQNFNRKLMVAADMPALKWDPKLAEMAQKHADLCSNFHSNHEGVYGKRVELDGVILGENIWGGTNDKLDMTSVANVWFDEGKEFGCDKRGWECCNEKCSHFSQEVWSETKKIGCGMTKCSMLDSWLTHGWKRTDDIFKYYQLFSIVCYYNPGGNVLHEKAYFPADKSNPWCSKCEGDFKCVDNLCEYND